MRPNGFLSTDDQIGEITHRCGTTHLGRFAGENRPQITPRAVLVELHSDTLRNMLAAIAIALAAIVVPTGDPPPSRVTIDVVTINGTGCPAGTVAVAVSPDNTKFSLIYANLIAQVGGTSKPTDARRFCTATLRVNAAGYAAGIARAEYRGFAHLESGASASLRLRYSFPGILPIGDKTKNFTGPFSDDWSFVDDQPARSACGGSQTLTLGVDLKVSLGTSDPKKTSFVAMDSVDGSLGQTYDFAWTRCP
ncbi:DUF4360 domain-containing protein [Lentzea sp. NPDC051213]|uniref:DUF4360 domain-containing protein n=1 Tax=Lentzea sp. NPDC051213 TaxID=3364126 RepID=UPI0037AA92AD